MEGEGPCAATLSRGSIEASGAEIQFDEYAVGSHAEGSYGCGFPMEDLKAIALATAPLP